jgi:hypothetical protein
MERSFIKMIVITTKYTKDNVKVELDNVRQVISLVKDKKLDIDTASLMYKSMRQAIESYWFENPKERVIPSKNHPLIQQYNKWLSPITFIK